MVILDKYLYDIKNEEKRIHLLNYILIRIHVDIVKCKRIKNIKIIIPNQL